MLKDYRDRNEIEMDMNSMKGLLDIERLFLQLPERIEAYAFLKVLALFMLSFLRWYTNSHGQKKVTEEKIHDIPGKMGLVQQVIEPIGYAQWAVCNDSGLAQFLRESFDLPNPQELVDRINQRIHLSEVIQHWLLNWQKDRVQLEGKCKT